MRIVVLDIETQNTFQEVGSSDPTKLDIAVVSIYDSETDTYRSFLQKEFSELFKILEHTDIIVGFNSDYFDIPLLNKYYPGDLTKIKSIDLLSAVKKSIGKRIPLDSLAAGTLGSAKSAKGIDAVIWWKQGQIDKIKQYCEQDVKITKELYDFALANKFLKYKFITDVSHVPIDTSNWSTVEKQAINLTMPW